MATDAKRAMTQMIGMFSTGDIASASDTIAQDYHDHQGIAGAEIRGVAGFCEVVRAARSPFATLDAWAEDLIADRDRAAARIRWRGVLPSGAAVERETIDFIRTASGRAVEHWGCQILSREITPN